MSRLLKEYREKIVDDILKTSGYKNRMQVPRLKKIVINVGLGEATQNPKVVELCAEQIATITGQKPVITKAKVAISNFKLRKGLPIGCMVTLRGNMMMEFFDRLVSVALPRVRDFKGVSSKAFDGRGNYTLGIKEQSIFPEIHYSKIDKVRGMNITIVTNARTDEEAKVLLQKMGMPFR